MTTTLSSKGQVVLPQAARRRLGLKAGIKFDCRVRGNEIVLTPHGLSRGKPRLIRDELTGLVVTEAPRGALTITDEQVRAILSDFP